MAVVIVIRVVQNKYKCHSEVVSAAKTHGTPPGTDTESGEDVGNWDQSESVEDIDCLGMDMFAYCWDALITCWAPKTTRIYPCVLESSSHLSWHVLVF